MATNEKTIKRSQKSKECINQIKTDETSFAESEINKQKIEFQKLCWKYRKNGLTQKDACKNAREDIYLKYRFFIKTQHQCHHLKPC